MLTPKKNTTKANNNPLCIQNNNSTFHKIIIKLKSIENYKYYTFIALFVGLCFLFITPPLQSPDEMAHFYRAYQLSDFQIISTKLSDDSRGGMIPKSVVNTFNGLQTETNGTFNIQKTIKALSIPLNATDTTLVKFSNTAIYPPIAHLPQAIGISIGKVFSASPIILLYLARLTNLLVWILILFFCIKRNQKFALPIFTIAILPIVAFQGSSASADVITTGLAISLSAEILSAIMQKNILAKKHRIIIICLSIALSLCKFPYTLISMLGLIIPHNNFQSKKDHIIFKLLACALPLAIMSAWLMIACLHVASLKDGVDSAAQIHMILSHPKHYLAALFNTYITYDYGDEIIIELIGRLGPLNVALPIWCIIAGSISVVIATITSNVSIPKYARIISLLTMLGLVLTIITIMYLTWSLPGSLIIEGLQGRYFIPLAGLFIGSIGGLIKVEKNSLNNLQMFICTLSILTIVGAIITVICKFY